MIASIPANVISFPSEVHNYRFLAKNLADASKTMGPNPTYMITITLTHECATVPTLVPDSAKLLTYTIGEPMK